MHLPTSSLHQLTAMISFDQSIYLLLRLSFRIGLVMIQITHYLISRDFSIVESIEIGDDCFGSVQIFKIEGLNQLKRLKIGNNSFTQNKNSVENNVSKSFHILNCESLESIQIGEYSFSDYAGEFELKNLPQLEESTTITIHSNWINWKWFIQFPFLFICDCRY